MIFKDFIDNEISVCGNFLHLQYSYLDKIKINTVEALRFSILFFLLFIIFYTESV